MLFKISNAFHRGQCSFNDEASDFYQAIIMQERCCCVIDKENVRKLLIVIVPF